MAENKVKVSDRLLPRGAINDIASLSLNARYKILVYDLVGVTLTNGVSHNLGLAGIAGTVVAAYANNRTVGTYTSATIKLKNATQSLDITATLDPSTVATGGAAKAFSLAASQPANAATDNVVLVASGTFTAQPVEMVITIIIDPAEASNPISQ